jgi:hypothetical protein
MGKHVADVPKAVEPIAEPAPVEVMQPVVESAPIKPIQQKGKRR